MQFQHIAVRKDGPIAWVTLNRPERLNVISHRMTSELKVALDDAERDEEVRVVILHGAGRAFCAGADLKDHPSGSGIGDDIGFCGLWEKIEHLGKPVIAAIHGYAITGGLLMAYCADIVIAAEGTKLGDTHARLGLVPTAGETQRLPRVIGSMKAKEMMFTSELIDAIEAEKMGLVSRVVALDRLNATAEEIALKIAANSPKSIKFIKTLVNGGMQVDFATGMRMEALANKWGTVNAEPDEDRDRRVARFRGQGK